MVRESEPGSAKGWGTLRFVADGTSGHSSREEGNTGVRHNSPCDPPPSGWRQVNRILGIFVLRPWSWVVDFTFAGEICAAFGFDFVYPSFPEHITRPLPWFESIHFFPSFDKDDSR